MNDMNCRPASSSTVHHEPHEKQKASRRFDLHSYLRTASQAQPTMVVPATRLPESWINLSILDKFILPIYIPIYFIYKDVPLCRFEEFVSKLRDSLSQALVPYYPFAGRLRKSHTTDSWEIHCDNGGVEFRVVHVHEELRRTKFSTPCMELRLLAPRLDAVPGEDTATPALSVQVTRFTCGAVALGCSFHHHCGDAYSVSMFMQAWSQLAGDKPLSFSPNHSRSSFIPSESTDSIIGSAAQPPAPVEIVGTKSTEETTTVGQVNKPKSMPSVEDDFGEEYTMEALVFEGDSPRKLKAMAGPGCTTFEATTAFLVRHMARASPVPDDNLVKFVLMVDYRGRLAAGEFAGNFALPKAVITNREKFVSGGLGTSVQPIHEAIVGADEAYFRSFVKHAGKGPPRKERALAVSSCARLPLYEVDFGYGAPVLAGINPPVPRLVPEFLLSLPNVKNRDGFVVFVQLHKNVLRKLLDDPEFMSIAKRFSPLVTEPTSCL